LTPNLPQSVGMTVVPFPILTIEAIVPRDWEPVLTLPIPRRPSLQLLEAARGQVLLYLDWIMTDMVQTDSALAVRQEIERAANRLLEIAAAMPSAIEVHAERCLAVVDERSLAWLLQWAGQKDGGEPLVRQILRAVDNEIK